MPGEPERSRSARAWPRGRGRPRPSGACGRSGRRRRRRGSRRRSPGCCPRAEPRPRRAARPRRARTTSARCSAASRRARSRTPPRTAGGSPGAGADRRARSRGGGGGVSGRSSSGIAVTGSATRTQSAGARLPSVAVETACSLTGDDLTVEDVWAVAVDGGRAALSGLARERMRAAREVVDHAVHGRREHTYGVNTGFGRFVSRSIPEELTEELQLRLLRSHCVRRRRAVPGRDRARGDAPARERAREGRPRARASRRSSCSSSA